MVRYLTSHWLRETVGLCYNFVSVTSQLNVLVCMTLSSGSCDGAQHQVVLVEDTDKTITDKACTLYIVKC